ncbi:MAG: N-acetylmuramoyl-L-alanine amidase [Candidatus Methanomethylicaceae archaeon]
MFERTKHPTLIVFHCSDTEDGPGNNTKAIREYHISHNGWDDIGYHFVLERLQNSYVLFPGRSPKFIGAHAAGHNHESLGVCIVGKYENEVPDQAFSAAVSALAMLCLMYGLDAESIKGHRELSGSKGKTCPGAAWDLDRLRRHVAVYLNRLRAEGMRLVSA